MGRKKIKQGKSKLFYLEEETIDEIGKCSGLSQMSASSYIDFIIKRDKISRNPMLKIKDIQLQKDKLQERINQLNKEEKIEITEASNLHEWQENKKIKKSEAIVILKQKILEEEFEEAEVIAKTWERITGIPAISLLIEARALAVKEGI